MNKCINSKQDEEENPALYQFYPFSSVEKLPNSSCSNLCTQKDPISNNSSILIGRINRNLNFSVVQEIREREDWIVDMAHLGQDKKYREIIDLQIQERIREMNRLDLEASDTPGTTVRMST